MTTVTTTNEPHFGGERRPWPDHAADEPLAPAQRPPARHGDGSGLTGIDGDKSDATMATESRAFVSHDDSDGASSQAIVLIDRSSRCVWHTVRAAQVIGFQCSCLEIGHRFCFTSRHVQAWLEHQLLQLDQGVSGARPSFATSDEVRSGTMLANHDSRRPIVLFARPTPSLDVGTSWPKALLSLQAVDLNQPPHLLGSVLQQVFGLTATETIVAQLLVDGLTPSAIATVRRIAISTVRAHLKSLYLKTRTRGQVELTRVLLQTSCV